jgi:Tol biopolymer transport system component
MRPVGKTAIALLAVVGFAAFASPAGATFPGSPGRIAFNRSNHIYSMRADGSDVRRLTSGSDLDQEPAWSASGKRIAFARQVRERHVHIWVMSATGSGAQRVTGGRHDDFQPAWAPAGSRIAFTRDVSGGQAIFVVKIGESARRVISGYDASWSPDGDWLAIGRPYGGKEAVFLVHPSGRGLKRLTPKTLWTEDPNWAPSAKRVAFVIVNRRGRDVSKWSSDIAVMNKDGTGLTRITHNHPGQDVEPAWSPGGKRLVFGRITLNSSGQMVESLYTIKLGATTPHKLISNGLQPDWQPLT